MIIIKKYEKIKKKTENKQLKRVVPMIKMFS